MPTTTSRRKTGSTGQGGLIVLLSGTLLINLGALGFLSFGDLLSSPAIESELPVDEGVALVDATPSPPQPPPLLLQETLPQASDAPQGAIDLPIEHVQETPASVVEPPVGIPAVLPPAVTLPVPAVPVALPEEQPPAGPPVEFFGIGLD